MKQISSRCVEPGMLTSINHIYFILCKEGIGDLTANITQHFMKYEINEEYFEIEVSTFEPNSTTLEYVLAP